MNHRVLMFLGFAALIGTLGLSGCATIWVIGKKPLFVENQRSQEVPMPGTTETLTVSLGFNQLASSQSQSTTGTDTDTTATTSHISFACAVAQHGRTKEYRAGTHYGRNWKIGTALMFVLEGLAATGSYFLIDAEGNSPGDKAAAILMTGWMGVDAVGTGILYFMPRRDVYNTHEKASSVPVRSDCPEGLAIEINGRPVPINALGQVGALGQALFEQYMTDSSPGQPALRLRVGEHSAEIHLDAADRCTWAKTRGHESARTLCEAMPQPDGNSKQERSAITVTMEVPPGTFTGPPPPPEPSPEPSQSATESPLEPWAPSPSDQSPSP